MHKGFRLDTEGISDAIDVIEVTNYLSGIMDSAVVHTMRTEHIEVGRTHLLWGARQLFSVFTQSAIKG